jgi:hypothetical protein
MWGLKLQGEVSLLYSGFRGVFVITFGLCRTLVGLYWKLRHTQYSSHWNDDFGATDRVSSMDDLSKFYSSGDPPFRGGVRLALSLRP